MNLRVLWHQGVNKRFSKVRPSKLKTHLHHKSFLEFIQRKKHSCGECETQNLSLIKKNDCSH